MKNRKTVWKSPTRHSRFGDGARAGACPVNGGGPSRRCPWTVWQRAFGPATLLTLLLAAGHLPLAATDVTGTIKLSDGTLVNGAIEFILSQPATTTTPPQLFARRKTTCAVTNGAIAGGCTVQGNDTLSPAGTFYSVRIIDSNNIEILPPTNYTISGAAVDLGALAIAADATLQLPSGTVSGNSTITGNLTVSGTTTLNGGLTWTPPLNLVNTVAGTVPFTAKAAAGQTADLFQLINNAGTNLIEVDSSGKLGLGVNPDTLLHVKGDAKFKNSADAALTMTLDCGSTTAQLCEIAFKDQGTTKWQLRKSSANTFLIIEASGSVSRVQLVAAADNRYRTGSLTAAHEFMDSAGTIRVAVPGDLDGLKFGSAADTNLYRAAANLLKTDDSLEVAGGTITLGAVTITAASGAPSGGCATGSLYLRTDGAAGTTLYVCESAAWSAK